MTTAIKTSIERTRRRDVELQILCQLDEMRRNAIQGKDGECKKRGICLEEEMGRNKKSAR